MSQHPRNTSASPHTPPPADRANRAPPACAPPTDPAPRGRSQMADAASAALDARVLRSMWPARRSTELGTASGAAVAPPSPPDTAAAEPGLPRPTRKSAPPAPRAPHCRRSPRTPTWVLPRLCLLPIVERPTADNIEQHPL